MNLQYINHLFDYTEWANDLALNSASSLSDEHLRRDFGISHSSIFGTLCHVAGAEWIWLERWNGKSPNKAEAWSQWTTDSCADLSVLRDRWNSVIERRRNYLSELNDAALKEEHPFKLLSGDESSMRLDHQLHHVVNHSTMHRGQIVGMIRQLGIDPPSTDMIFFVRQDISPK